MSKCPMPIRQEQPLTTVQLSFGPGADGYSPSRCISSLFCIVYPHKHDLKKCEIAVERFGTRLAWNIEQHSHLVMKLRSLRSSVCSLRSSSAVQWECVGLCMVYPVCWLNKINTVWLSKKMHFRTYKTLGCVCAVDKEFMSSFVLCR